MNIKFVLHADRSATGEPTELGWENLPESPLIGDRVNLGDGFGEIVLRTWEPDPDSNQLCLVVTLVPTSGGIPRRSNGPDPTERRRRPRD